VRDGEVGGECHWPHNASSGNVWIYEFEGFEQHFDV
jgi:hypothetical protein